jgi:hypothetical protein
MCAMTVPPSDGPASQTPPPTRVVVIVPRREPGVHEYLQRALASIKDVEVVLDRRAVAVSRAHDRRRAQSKDERQLLLCSLVHCPVEPPAPSLAPPPMGAQETAHHRSLPWPDLRLEHLSEDRRSRR